MPTPEAFNRSVSSALRYLEQIGLSFEIIDDEEDEWLILGYLSTDIGHLRISVLLQQSPPQVVTYAYHTLVVLKPIRGKAAEFIARANYGLPVGNFELDMDDGELRFKVGFPMPPEGATPELIAHTLDVTLGTLAHYHTPLVRTLFDGLTPAEAIEELEKGESG